jgi:hypothetical protein
MYLACVISRVKIQSIPAGWEIDLSSKLVAMCGWESVGLYNAARDSWDATICHGVLGRIACIVCSVSHEAN